MNLYIHKQPFAEVTKIFLLLVGFIGITSCASRSAQQVAPAPSLEVGPQAGTSRIYLMRRNTFQAGGVPMLALDGENPVGAYGPKDYLVWDRPAGKTTITVVAIRGRELDQVLSKKFSLAEVVALYAEANADWSPIKGSLALDASAGGTLYILQSTKVPGVYSSKPVTILLESVSAEEGRQFLSQRHPVRQ